MNTAQPLRVEGVTHRYGGTLALQPLDLDIPPGRLVGFIGPDGVGKSTLLGLMTGAKALQSGRIDVLGGNIGDAAHRRRVCPRIAFMPQGLGRNLYPTLTVRENLEFFAHLFATGERQRGRRIDRLLAATGLAPFPDRPVEKLSGGMKQKLGLCCALIHDPDVLVLDEPTTGVDPLSRRQFWALIEEIRSARAGMSLLTSTAYLEEAQSFDWLAAMYDGRVLATGTPAEICARTNTENLDEAYRALRPDATPNAAFAIAPRRAGGHDTVISAHGLTKRFGDFTAVESVSFEIERGEIFGFVGSNGCGKTTTMKMLVGLLRTSAGEALLLGQPVSSRRRTARRDIGYMSQAFSLFGELSVAQNLSLHARVFSLDALKRRQRIEHLTERFGLEPYADTIADTLPLGVRQRLSLAVAIIHEPSVLILDEPTSGVDPDARDRFWEILGALSREQGVTIFISTHFMNEAMRCDRIALMHAGRVLACDTPDALMTAADAATLEDAFIEAMEQASDAQASEAMAPAPAERLGVSETQPGEPPRFSLARCGAYARRERIEILRDPVRLAFALLGSALMMVLFCLGVSLDIEDLKFVAVDLDQSPASRKYIAAFEGSRYFTEYQPRPRNIEAAKRLLVDGEVTLLLEIPPRFGRQLHKGEKLEVLAVVDGALPFRGETVEGYVAGIHSSFLANHAHETRSAVPQLATIEPRFRYNQSFESIRMMAPGMPAMLLIMLPAVLTAVSVARERELGSITNFYVTPTTRLEFLAGKQAPYIVIAFVNFLLLSAMTIWVFGVPLKGSVLGLIIGAALYVWATTAFGLVMSTLTSSQVAAVFATTLSALIPTIQFSGLLQPVSTLEGGARAIGSFWPATYFLHLSVGAFTKGLDWAALVPDLLALALFGPVLTLIAVLLLRVQER
ncbi:MAG: ribosome-associated ATPase/putative transporter RbbA [Gammaproteobacteria bacterium]|nr:ribosome-associated ATPase/putative transporter RbbA [Gammaproteobacteria bacterium]